MGLNRDYKIQRRIGVHVFLILLVVGIFSYKGVTEESNNSPSNLDDFQITTMHVPQYIYSEPSSGRVLAQELEYELSWPVEGGIGTVTQCISDTHNGIDIADFGYPDVISSHRGKVTFAGCQSGYCPPDDQEIGGKGLARTVIVEHANGLSTIYAHLNKVYVAEGEYVETGTPLGQMGRSGDTNGGVHLHFMLAEWGEQKIYNPAKYMDPIKCPQSEATPL